jgi:hypothetical protein
MIAIQTMALRWRHTVQQEVLKMNLGSRQFVAAALIFCPLVVWAQESDLPSAPSAVIAERGFQKARVLTFTNGPTREIAPKPSSRLDSTQKFSSFVEQSMSPYATFSSAIQAGFHPIGSNAQYTENYAGRMGQTMANSTEEAFFTKFLLPSMLHQDPRYHASTESGTVDRAFYATSRVLVGRTDNGKPTLNTSELVGAVLAASITSAYHPYRHPTNGQTAGNAATTIGSDAGINMLREFWPDIRSHLMDGPKIMQSLVTQFGPRIQAASVPANQ